jgi:hypothetical protein
LIRCYYSWETNQSICYAENETIDSLLLFDAGGDGESPVAQSSARMAEMQR